MVKLAERVLKLLYTYPIQRNNSFKKIAKFKKNCNILKKLQNFKVRVIFLKLSENLYSELNFKENVFSRFQTFSDSGNLSKLHLGVPKISEFDSSIIKQI